MATPLPVEGKSVKDHGVAINDYIFMDEDGDWHRVGNMAAIEDDVAKQYCEAYARKLGKQVLAARIVCECNPPGEAEDAPKPEEPNAQA